MPTVIFKVDCGRRDPKLDQELRRLENKVQEALTEIDYDYLVFDTEYRKEALLDREELDCRDEPLLTVASTVGQR